MTLAVLWVASLLGAVLFFAAGALTGRRGKRRLGDALAAANAQHADLAQALERVHEEQAASAREHAQAERRSHALEEAASGERAAAARNQAVAEQRVRTLRA